MSDFSCARCGAAGPRIEPPHPTKLGREIAARICGNCWNEWGAQKVMIINEYRLNLLEKTHRATLRRQMKAFLKLSDEQVMKVDYVPVKGADEAAAASATEPTPASEAAPAAEAAPAPAAEAAPAADPAAEATADKA